MASARGIGTKQVTDKNHLEVMNREVIPLLNALARAAGAWLSATDDWTPGVVAAGGFVTHDVTVNGARVGDVVAAGFDQVSGALVGGQVTADNTVTVTLFDATGLGMTLAAGTVTALVWRRT